MKCIRSVACPEVHADIVDPPTGRRTIPVHPQGLGEAHAGLQITTEGFDAVGAEIDRALDHLGVPEREQQELVTVIVANTAEVVGSPR
jgi:truncated hemoglobin YjbI